MEKYKDLLLYDIVVAGLQFNNDRCQLNDAYCIKRKQYGDKVKLSLHECKANKECVKYKATYNKAIEKILKYVWQAYEIYYVTDVSIFCNKDCSPRLIGDSIKQVITYKLCDKILLEIEVVRYGVKIMRDIDNENVVAANIILAEDVTIAAKLRIPEALSMYRNLQIVNMENVGYPYSDNVERDFIQLCLANQRDQFKNIE